MESIINNFPCSGISIIMFVMLILRLATNRPTWMLNSKFIFGISSHRTCPMNRKLHSDSSVLPGGQIRYSTNKKWHAAMNFIPRPRDIPPYQYPVIFVSVAVCLVYFCFLREENSMDDILAGKITVEDIRKAS